MLSGTKSVEATERNLPVTRNKFASVSCRPLRPFRVEPTHRRRRRHRRRCCRCCCCRRRRHRRCCRRRRRHENGADPDSRISESETNFALKVHLSL